MYLNVTNLIVACKHPLGSTVTPGRHDFSSRCQIWQIQAEKRGLLKNKTATLKGRKKLFVFDLLTAYSIIKRPFHFVLPFSLYYILFLIHLRDDIMITGVCKESVCVSVCQDWCLRCWYWKAIKQQVCLCLSLEVVISFRRSALAQQSSLKLLQCVPTRNAHTLLPARNESKKSFKTI